MKLNRKFLKKVQREFKPRKSIQYIRECYKNGGIFHETEEFTTKVFRSKDLYKFKQRYRTFEQDIIDAHAAGAWSLSKQEECNEALCALSSLFEFEPIKGTLIFTWKEPIFIKGISE